MVALDGTLMLLVTLTVTQVLMSAGLPFLSSATNRTEHRGLLTECGALHKRGLLPAPASVPDGIPNFLKEYAKIHQAYMLRLANHPRNIPPQMRFLVFHCVQGQCGGMGDRFKGIMGAFYLAVVTRRVFIIQHDEFPLTDLVVPNAIDWHTLASCLPTYRHRGQSTPLNAFHPPSNYMVDKRAPGRGGVFDADRLISDVLNAQTRTVHLRLNHPIWNQILDSPKAASLMHSRGYPRHWTPPRGPRFAWGWHLLFRLSEGMEQTLAQHKRALGIPTDGTPWVAVHIRTGTSEQFKDDLMNGQLCNGFEQGITTWVECAARFADLVSRPPFAKLDRKIGKPVDPRSVPIFIASDNNRALHAAQAQLLERGHAESAIAHSGRQAVHVGRLLVANATAPGDQNDSVRHTIMLTVVEMLLMSQATCMVMGKSGFSNVAEWLSRDMRTGARCAENALDCQPERVQALASPGAGDAANDKTRHGMYELTHMSVCSAFALVGDALCPTGTWVDLVFRFTLEHPGSLRARKAWKADRLRGILRRYLGLRDPCQVDVMIGRRGERWTPKFNITEVAATITLHVDDGGAVATLEALRARAFIVGQGIATFGDNVLFLERNTTWSLDTSFEIVIATGGAPPVQLSWDFSAPDAMSLPTELLPKSSPQGQDVLYREPTRQQQSQRLSTTSQQARDDLPRAASEHVPPTAQPGNHARDAPPDAAAVPQRTYCFISDEQVHINVRLAAVFAQDAVVGPPLVEQDPLASLLQHGGARVRVDQLAVMVQGSQVLVSADGNADMPASRHGVLGTVTVNGETLPATRSLRKVIPGNLGFRIRRDKGNFIILSIPDLIELRIEVSTHSPGQPSPATLHGGGTLRVSVTSFQASEHAQGMLGQQLQRRTGATQWPNVLAMMAKASKQSADYLTTWIFSADCKASRYGSFA
eukprot:jgi/Mesvir1/7721/Mv11667-RA.1